MQAVRSVVHPRGKTVSITIPPAFVGLDIEVVAFPAERQSKKPYDFSRLAGKLEWRGDAVKEQRKLRDEW